MLRFPSFLSLLKSVSDSSDRNTIIEVVLLNLNFSSPHVRIIQLRGSLIRVSLHGVSFSRTSLTVGKNGRMEPINHF